MGMPDKRRVEELLDEQYTRVKTLLAVHTEALHAIAQALLTHGELVGDDVMRIVEEKERERQSQDVIAREDTRRLAYDEAGKAVAEAMLVRRRELRRVSIVSNTEAHTFNELRPLTEQQTYSRDEFINEIQIRLASRAAEELFLGTVLDKSASDVKKARDLARYVVTYLNPGDSLFIDEPEYDGRNGHVQIPQAQTAGAPIPGVPNAPQALGVVEIDLPAERRESPMNERVRREVDRLLHDQYDSVKKLLRDTEAEVHQLARALAEKGELSADDVRRILNGKVPARTPDAILAAPPVAIAQSPRGEEPIGVGVPAQVPPPA
jgi:ATP-dependent Zn protease